MIQSVFDTDSRSRVDVETSRQQVNNVIIARKFREQQPQRFPLLRHDQLVISVDLVDLLIRPFLSLPCKCICPSKHTFCIESLF